MMIIWWSKHVGVILNVLVCDILINVLLQTNALVGPLCITTYVCFIYAVYLFWFVQFIFIIADFQSISPACMYRALYSYTLLVNLRLWVHFPRIVETRGSMFVFNSLPTYHMTKPTTYTISWTTFIIQVHLHVSAFKVIFRNTILLIQTTSSKMNPPHTVSLFSPKSKPPFMFPSRYFSSSSVATVWSRVVLFTEFVQNVYHVTLCALVTFKIVSISVLYWKSDLYQVSCICGCEDWYCVLPIRRRHFSPPEPCSPPSTWPQDIIVNQKTTI
jgi:hypothetical protein